MGGSPRAVHGNPLAKVVFAVAAILLAFAPPTVRAEGAAESYDFQICRGYFALCAASTCTPTGGQITVRTATGGTATFPEADCKCPVPARATEPSVPITPSPARFRYLSCVRPRPCMDCYLGNPRTA
jgi:hypothetical protein